MRFNISLIISLMAVAPERATAQDPTAPGWSPGSPLVMVAGGTDLDRVHEYLETLRRELVEHEAGATPDTLCVARDERQSVGTALRDRLAAEGALSRRQAQELMSSAIRSGRCPTMDNATLLFAWIGSEGRLVVRVEPPGEAAARTEFAPEAFDGASRASLWLWTEVLAPDVHGELLAGVITVAEVEGGHRVCVQDGDGWIAVEQVEWIEPSGSGVTPSEEERCLEVVRQPAGPTTVRVRLLAASGHTRELSVIVETPGPPPLLVVGYASPSEFDHDVSYWSGETTSEVAPDIGAAQIIPSDVQVELSRALIERLGTIALALSDDHVAAARNGQRIRDHLSSTYGDRLLSVVFGAMAQRRDRPFWTNDTIITEPLCGALREALRSDLLRHGATVDTTGGLLETCGDMVATMRAVAIGRSTPVAGWRIREVGGHDHSAFETANVDDPSDDVDTVVGAVDGSVLTPRDPQVDEQHYSVSAFDGSRWSDPVSYVVHYGRPTTFAGVGLTLGSGFELLPNGSAPHCLESSINVQAFIPRSLADGVRVLVEAGATYTHEVNQCQHLQDVRVRIGIGVSFGLITLLYLAVNPGEADALRNRVMPFDLYLDAFFRADMAGPGSTHPSFVSRVRVGFEIVANRKESFFPFLFGEAQISLDASAYWMTFGLGFDALFGT